MKSTTQPAQKKSAAQTTSSTSTKAGGTDNKNATTSSVVAAENGKPQEKQTEKQQPSKLEKFFVSQLNDIYSAEKQLTEALPKMKQAASTEELQDAFEKHLKQTERHVTRLDKVFKHIGKTPQPETCEAMKGLIKEAEKIIQETDEGTMARDAALIMAAQKVEHYEIASYGGLVQFAITMELDAVAELLERTLYEEEQTDLDLTDIAEEFINVEADGEQEYSWQKSAEQ